MFRISEVSLYGRQRPGGTRGSRPCPVFRLALRPSARGITILHYIIKTCYYIMQSQYDVTIHIYNMIVIIKGN